MAPRALTITDANDDSEQLAISLLVRFFREEGFGTSEVMIARNVREMIADPHHWIGLGRVDI